MSNTQTGLDRIGELFTAEPSRSAFPVPTPESVAQMEAEGFGKLGYAFGIEDPLGRVFVFPHKTQIKNGVTDGQWGVPSETVKGRFVDGYLEEIETLEQALARCLLHEQVLRVAEAPESASLEIVRAEPFSIIDWNMSHNHDPAAEAIKNTFGVAIALRANVAMAEFIATTRQPTDEGHGGFFQSTDFLNQQIENGEIRPAFDAWLTQYQDLNALSDAEPVAIAIPEIVSGSEWKGLRFAQLGGVAIRDTANE